MQAKFLSSVDEAKFRAHGQGGVLHVVCFGLIDICPETKETPNDIDAFSLCSSK